MKLATKRSDKYLDEQKKRTKKSHKKSKKNKKSKHKEVTSESEEGTLLQYSCVNYVEQALTLFFYFEQSHKLCMWLAH